MHSLTILCKSYVKMIETRGICEKFLDSLGVVGFGSVVAPLLPHGSPLKCARSLPLGGNVQLDFMTLEHELPFEWGTSSCHLFSVNFGEEGSMETINSLHSLTQLPKARVARAIRSLGLPLSGLGSVLPRPKLSVQRISLDDEAPLAAPSAAQPQAGLREVVLGCEDGEAFMNTQSLASTVCIRDPNVLSIWKAPGGRHFLRLIPSSYSALIFHPVSMSSVEERLGEQGITSELYGMRRGSSTETGQLRVFHEALAGLDIRICTSRFPRHVFCETRQTLTDVMDPSLNGDHAASGASLACKSIVGMDMVSTLKLRLTGRVG